MRTLDLSIIPLRLPHQQRRRLTVQRISRIRISEKLWEEDFEDVDHVEHGGPSLIDDIEADGAGQLVDVGMEDSVYEADAG